MAVTVSDQDRSLLRLIADGEAVRSNPYCSVWPGSVERSLTSMTLSQVEDYQKNRIAAGRKSSAVGKYQFIKSTLKECVGYLGCDPLRTVFSPDVQDALIIKRLEKFRRYNEWKSGALDSGKFMIFLSAEFASMPVPYDIAAGSVYKGLPKRNLKKVQSFYAGDGLNKANHNPDSVYQALEDIRNGGTGEIVTIDVSTTGANRAMPASGIGEKAQVEKASAGSATGAYRGTRAGSAPLPATTLPNPENPYIYYQIDPLDDRYDFRTGEKVKDILIHGISAAASSPVEVVTGGETNSTTNAGVIAPVPPAPDPESANPTGQEVLPDLVPKEVPSPLPLDDLPNVDKIAPGLPYPDDIIDDALNSIKKLFPEDPGDCVNTPVTRTSGFQDAFDDATGAYSDVVGGLKDAAETALTETKTAITNTAKQWIKTNGPQ